MAKQQHQVYVKGLSLRITDVTPEKMIKDGYDLLFSTGEKNYDKACEMADAYFEENKLFDRYSKSWKF